MTELKVPPKAKRTRRSAQPDQPMLIPAAQFSQVSRRQLLRLAPLGLAAAFCVPGAREELLSGGLALSDWASQKTFSGRLAQTFADADVVPFEKFPYNSFNVVDPGIDLKGWTLTVEGLVRFPGEYTLAQILALPKVTQSTRHICIEGWDAIGNFGGCRISDFLALVGAEHSARFLEVECADDYYESLDMQSVLHSQSLLCYEMYRRPLDRGHGAPLRLQMPTKLGYKQAKYITALRVRNSLPKERGYWEDQGYSWYGGI